MNKVKKSSQKQKSAKKVSLRANAPSAKANNAANTLTAEQILQAATRNLSDKSTSVSPSETQLSPFAKMAQAVKDWFRQKPEAEQKPTAQESAKISEAKTRENPAREAKAKEAKAEKAKAKAATTKEVKTKQDQGTFAELFGKHKPEAKKHVDKFHHSHGQLAGQADLDDDLHQAVVEKPVSFAELFTGKNAKQVLDKDVQADSALALEASASAAAKNSAALAKTSGSSAPTKTGKVVPGYQANKKAAQQKSEQQDSRQAEELLDSRADVVSTLAANSTLVSGVPSEPTKSSKSGSSSSAKATSKADSFAALFASGKFSDPELADKDAVSQHAQSYKGALATSATAATTTSSSSASLTTPKSKQSKMFQPGRPEQPRSKNQAAPAASTLTFAAQAAVTETGVQQSWLNNTKARNFKLDNQARAWSNLVEDFVDGFADAKDVVSQFNGSQVNGKAADSPARPKVTKRGAGKAKKQKFTGTKTSGEFAEMFATSKFQDLQERELYESPVAANLGDSHSFGKLVADDGSFASTYYQKNAAKLEAWEQEYEDFLASERREQELAQQAERPGAESVSASLGQNQAGSNDFAVLAGLKQELQQSQHKEKGRQSLPTSGTGASGSKAKQITGYRPGYGAKQSIPTANSTPTAKSSQFERELQRVQDLAEPTSFVDKTGLADWTKGLGAIKPLQAKTTVNPSRARSASLAQEQLQAERAARQQAQLLTRKEHLEQSISQDAYAQANINLEFISDVHMRFNEHNFMYASFLAPDLDPELFYALKSGNLPIDLEVDLHGLTKEQAKIAVLESIKEAFRLHESVIRYTTGHGKNILKQALPNWLIQHSRVAAFIPVRDAKQTNGFLVLLKNVQKELWAAYADH